MPVIIAANTNTMVFIFSFCFVVLLQITFFFCPCGIVMDFSMAIKAYRHPSCCVAKVCPKSALFMVDMDCPVAATLNFAIRPISKKIISSFLVFV